MMCLSLRHQHFRSIQISPPSSITSKFKSTKCCVYSASRLLTPSISLSHSSHHHLSAKPNHNTQYSIFITHRNSTVPIMLPTTTTAIDSIHHPATGTWQYIVVDPNTLNAVIIDPVLDFDAATQTVTTKNADNLVSTIKAKGYNIVRILETHVHADHLTASAYLQQALASIQDSKPPICIGKRITQVQQTFGKKYSVPASELENAFDHLLDDDEVFQIGHLQAKVVHLPGHTPDHVGYLIGGEFHEQV